jgi:CheY-like chemotaxis protein
MRTMARSEEDVRRRLLLVEDDDGDALLVEELLRDSGEAYEIRRPSISAAADLVDGAECALVDLELPDAAGLSAVEQLRAYAPRLAIVVLTGLGDKARGVEAVAAGARTT